MTMPGRNWKLESSAYRYGYQGSEINQETHNNSNQYTTEFRQLDVRFGRWFSRDPYFMPWQSPYNSMDGNPINLNDVLGAGTPKYENYTENADGTISAETTYGGETVKHTWSADGTYLHSQLKLSSGGWTDPSVIYSMVELSPVVVNIKHKHTSSSKKAFESMLQQYRDLKQSVEDFRDEGNSLAKEIDDAINDYLKSVPEGEFWDALKELEESLFPSGFMFYVTNGDGELGPQRKGDHNTEAKDITGLLEYFEAMAPKRPKFKGNQTKLGKAYDKVMDLKGKIEGAVSKAQDKYDDLQEMNEKYQFAENLDQIIEYRLSKYDESQMKDIVKKRDYVIKGKEGKDSIYSFYQGVLMDGLRLDVVDKDGDTSYSEIFAPPPTR